MCFRGSEPDVTMHRPSLPGPVRVIAGDPLRGQRLCRRLERLGFAVQANAPQGPAQAGTEAGHAPDAGTVLLLDLGGPPGWALHELQALRERQDARPLLAMAAGQTAQERVLALDRGADDCVSGDISDAELAARLRVQLRRVAAEAARWIRCGPLAYDQRDRTAVLGQEPLRLSQQELTLLEALIRRPGRFIAAPVLLNGLLRQRDSLSLNAVQVQVCRLRQKLRHSAVRIATLRGQGYCLEVEGGEQHH